MTEPPIKRNFMLLSVMMFLQFFTWGAWFTTLGQVLGSNNLSGFIGGAYGTAPIAAMVAPLFLGLIADRFMPSQIVMGLLLLMGGGFMFLAHGAAAGGSGDSMVWYFTGHMLCFMPTLGLANTIAFSNLDRVSFPKVRVWGTIGWIVAGLVGGGILGWTSDISLFKLAAGSSALLGLFCFILPHTPPPAKGEPVNLRALFMVDAFKLLTRPAFLVFMLSSLLICIPLAYYFAVTGNYLSNAGFKQAMATMSLGQMSEIFFMLLIPFFYRKLGVKWMIFIGMLAWVARYALFSMGAPDQVAWMLYLGVLLHGICYDFFFVTGFMYTDQTADKSIRGQAQSMLVFFTQGIGMWIGYKIAFGKYYGGDFTFFGNELGRLGGFFPNPDDALNPDYEALNTAITEAGSTNSVSYFEQFGQMFSKEIPEAVNPELVNTAMAGWKQYWMLPTVMAAGIALFFLLAFWDRDAKGSLGEDD